MPGLDDLALLERAARDAGKLALSFFRGRNEVWDKGSAGGPVSEADLAVDSYLREALTSARPDHGWLSEESEDSPERLSARRVFVVDPIDGTRAFVAGDTPWAHSIAIIEDGQPVTGVVYLPAKDRLYAALKGKGASLNGAPIRASERLELTGSAILAPRATFEPHFWPQGVPDVHRHFRPSLAYRLALVAEGRFDAMMTLRPSWEWDIAAGALIASEAGAEVSDATGAALAFNNPKPQTRGVLAAAPAVHKEILAGTKTDRT